MVMGCATRLRHGMVSIVNDRGLSLVTIWPILQKINNMPINIHTHRMLIALS